MSVNPSNTTRIDEQPDDRHIVAQCQAGDVNAFRRLVERYQQYAFAVAFRIVCEEDDAKDIVQEAFVRVWRNLRGFDPEKKFGTWLFKIVVNLAYDCLRMEKRKRRLFTPIAAGEELRATMDPGGLENVVSNKDLAEKIKALTAELSPKQRIVFVLRDLQDMTMEEISQHLGMSMSSVKANLCYARRNIRERLGRITK